MIEDIRKAKTAFQVKTQEVNEQLKEEFAQKRDDLVHRERYTLAKILQNARLSGKSVSELCRMYGTKNRKTVMDLLDYAESAFDKVEPERKVLSSLSDHLKVEHLEDGRVKIYTVSPIPVNMWQKANTVAPWEGTLTTDGVVSDDYGPLWEELRSTNLPFKLGIKEIFEL